jgi:hypothetical protein
MCCCDCCRSTFSLQLDPLSGLIMNVEMETEKTKRTKNVKSLRALPLFSFLPFLSFLLPFLSNQPNSSPSIALGLDGDEFGIVGASPTIN